MTEFQLIRKGKKAGLIDVTNKGAVIIDNQELADAFNKAGLEFARTEFHQDGTKISYFFRATISTETMMEMLIRFESILYLMGYQVEEYPSHRRCPAAKIDALP